MKSKVQLWLGSWLVAALVTGIFGPAVWAAPPAQTVECAEAYTVQADDWLSRLADRFYGDLTAYPAIVTATNQQNAVDSSFAAISNPDRIEIGWKLCVPTAEVAQALLAPPAANEPVALEPAEVTVFAAASLTDAFTEIAQNFSTQYPGVNIVYNFAGSQQLAQQLGQGAPADVFASANARQMGVAIEAGRVVSDTQQAFVRNRLVVIYPAENPAGLTQLADLSKPGLKLILAAAEVPVGQYSLDFMDKATQDPTFGPGYKDAVLQNVVSYEDNVRSVLAKISLGEGDAGIVYTSDISGAERDQVGRIDIPDALNTIATYPIAVISDAAHPTHAQVFIDYILSPAGQAVLTKYGFISVSKL